MQELAVPERTLALNASPIVTMHQTVLNPR